MKPADVAEVSAALAAAGVRHAVTGGWGADALVGEQTRPHRNLDVAVADLDGARAALGESPEVSLLAVEDPSVREEGEVVDGWLERVVPCLAPRVQRSFHTGLSMRPQDVHDLSIIVRAEHQRGIDAHGRILREGSAELIGRAFRPVVDDLIAFVRRAFGERVHSIYLYGSVVRGAAVPGASDLDAQVALRDDVTPADRERAASIGATLDELHESVRGLGVLIGSVAELTDPAEMHDAGFHLGVLCAPVWGEDLGEEIPRPRPTRALALGIQKTAPAALGRLRAALPEAESGDAEALCRSAGRRLARLAFALVMPRWGGWTSEPTTMALVFARLHPERAEEMADAVELGWSGRVDPVLALALCDGFGGWLVRELGL
ncbi:nucleotidyltransferase domain-containing protein [Nigerium sp.]|uniref:nucleotidyltransferase domain-containing protein n=1 Tax=Nigerium sp. TaxID=2042655 RepID=UPI0032216A33